MLREYRERNRARGMLELVMETPSGETIIPMQFPVDTSQEDILEAARRHIVTAYVSQVRVLALTSRTDTWRVTRTITKTITETEH